MFFIGLPNRSMKAAVLSFGEADTKQRIRNVLRYKKPAGISLAAAAVICLLAALCFLTNPVSNVKGAAWDGSLQWKGVQDAEVYAFQSLFYMNPLGSNIPIGDSGELYYIGKDNFTIVDSDSGNIKEHFTDLAWKSLDTETWSKIIENTLMPDIRC